MILGIMFLLAGGLVYAYGTSSPSVVGHSVGEINWNDKIDNINLGEISFEGLGSVSFYTPIANCEYPSSRYPYTSLVEVYAQARYVNGQVQTRAWTEGGRDGDCNGKSSGWENGTSTTLEYIEGSEICKSIATAASDGINVKGYNNLCSANEYGW